jgi:O-antigen/teichoic acid export membrane protein
MYISSILMLLSWPAVILLSWFAVRLALNLYEKKQEKAVRNLEKEL